VRTKIERASEQDLKFIGDNSKSDRHCPCVATITNQ
jgi:hypothetical protein